MATIHAATGGDPRGLEAAHMWSEKSPKYNAENTNDEWEHLDRYPFTAKVLVRSSTGPMKSIPTGSINIGT